MFKKVILDIEANNLLSGCIDYTVRPYKFLPTANIWGVVLTCVDTKKVKCLVPYEFVSFMEDYVPYIELFDKQYHDFFNTVEIEIIPLTRETLKLSLSTCEELIFHNGIVYDLPMLSLGGVLDYEVAYPLGNQESNYQTKNILYGKAGLQFVDTLLMSKLLNPDRLGGHSLKAWGLRLGEQKIEFTEFDKFSVPLMLYCIQDTMTTLAVYNTLSLEMKGTTCWDKALSMELKLADLTLKQEHFGFHFDSALAYQCLDELDENLTALECSVNPKLPPRALKKTEEKLYIPPAKQFKMDGTFSATMLNFAKRLGATLNLETLTFTYEGRNYPLPLDRIPIKESEICTISDLDHLKAHLITLGWDPSEWKERDLTRDAAKQRLSPEKFEATLLRYVENTLAGVFKDARLAKIGATEKSLATFLRNKYKRNPTKPLKVPTGPALRVGVEKVLCPDLVRLGETVSFVNDVNTFLTLRHRRNSIAGGSVDDAGDALTGYLSLVRPDGRVSTPADTIGASTNRYKHRNICNIPRPSSLYGEKLRSLFTAGPDWYQIGYDYASLENRIQAHYCIPYPTGPEYAVSLLANKPFDSHTLMGQALGIPRDSAKSVVYACLYGAAAAKLQKMLGLSPEDAEKMYNKFWDAVPALKELKQRVETYWEGTDRDHIVAIDGRLLRARSAHSLLNLLFQGSGAIAVKWATVLVAQNLDAIGILGDPFKHSDKEGKIFQMIVYHDEVQYAVPKSIINVKTFDNDDAAKEFKLENPDYSSDVGHSTKGKSYLTKSNILTQTIDKSIESTVKHLKLRVDLGYAWASGMNWCQTH